MRTLPSPVRNDMVLRPASKRGKLSVRSNWQYVLRKLREQLEQTQWHSANKILAFQRHHLALLVAHAYATVPWYREQWSATGIDANRFDPSRDWHRLPILRRQDIQKADQSLHSTEFPSKHGATYQTGTGGSTGQPVMVRSTDWTQLWFWALTLRDHLWHNRDFSQMLGAIRYSTDPSWAPPYGRTASNWGPATAIVGSTGPVAVLSVFADTEAQDLWLRHHTPGYLLTYPSALYALAMQTIDCDLPNPGLLQARTFGELLEPYVRKACRRAWNINVVDLYSSEEVGSIALQCPTGEHYHVQAESLYVEVLDDDDQPCTPGQVGRVVVTALHNYAMPLIRYDLGDYAEVGKACTCGRGLPVLDRIIGRQRNMFILPSGRKIWPSFVMAKDEDPLPPHQFQVVQKAIDQVEIRMVVDAPFTKAQEEQVLQRLRLGMGGEFKYTLAYVDNIPRSPRGKYEDFLCDIKG